MVDIFKKHDIKYVLLNGGNGTMVGGRYVEGSWHSYTDEDGTSYFDDKGNAWDDKGNTWNYYEIWDEIGIEH